VVESDTVVDTHRARRVRVGTLLDVDAVEDVVDRIDRLAGLAGEHGLGRGTRIVVGPLGFGKLVAAVGADGVSGGDERAALRAFLGRSTAAIAAVVVLKADLIDRPMSEHVSAVVQHETVPLARMQPETPTTHLIEQSRRKRRP